MRKTIENVNWSWCSVTSVVPQEAVLTPVIFVIYINDTVEEINNYMNLFADEDKLLKAVIFKEKWKAKIISIRYKNGDKCMINEVLEFGEGE